MLPCPAELLGLPARLSRFPQGEQTILKSIIWMSMSISKKSNDSWNSSTQIFAMTQKQAALSELEAEQKAIEQQAQRLENNWTPQLGPPIW